MSLSSIRKLALLVVSLSLVPLSQVRAQNASEKVGFDTVDGVRIEGTYYPSPKAGKSTPCVLLLHDFDHKTGGNHSRTDEWNALAASLQKADYSVLSFDFRGFGQSTGISPQVFWNPRMDHNMVSRRPSWPRSR